MYKKLIINDLKSSKVSSIAIFLFMVITSMLTSLIFSSTYNLIVSINELMDKAKAPHFIQMHLGDVNTFRMDSFAKSRSEVKSYQILPFVNVDSTDIYINGNIFTKHSQDNGFSAQSESFDFLLDMDNNVASPNVGEVYVPLSYYLSGDIKIGDTITIYDLDLLVKGPIRDVQMNSTLSTSKRFLVNQSDLNKIKQKGTTEYLIEFLLSDKKDLSAFQGHYENAKLENNGPTITHTLIILINALSDGMMIGLIALTSLLALYISFLCIRLTLLARLENDTKQIGVLKAIGITHFRIKTLYIAKYIFIAFIAGLCGYILSIIISPIILKKINIYFGSANNSQYKFAEIGIFITITLLLLYINRLLNKFKKLKPVEALKRNNNKNIYKPKIRLKDNIIKSSKTYLSFIKLYSRKKLYLTMILIIIFVTFASLLPRHLQKTLSSDEFIKYMGVGNVDAEMSIQRDLSKSELADLNEKLKTDDGVESFNILKQSAYTFELEDGRLSKFWIAHGDHEKFALNYEVGRPPNSKNEIALSYLLADELNKKFRDEIVIYVNNTKINLKIVGIYSDITNGGRTGQTIHQDWENPALKTTVYLNLNGDYNLSKNYPEFQITNIDDSRDEIFSSTINSLKSAKVLAFIASGIILILIGILFNHLLIAEDKKQNATMIALGFRTIDVNYKYYFNMIIISAIGIVVGLILSFYLGELIVSIFMNNLGIGRFNFSSKGFLEIIAQLCIYFVLIIFGTWISTRQIKNINISKSIKE